MQAERSDSCQERIEGQVAAPLEAAWDSIRDRTSPRPWRPYVRRLAEARRARRFRSGQRRARHRHAEPVHGRLGPLAFRRPARAGVEDDASARARGPGRRQLGRAAADAAADPRRSSGARRRADAIRRRRISIRATGSRRSSSARRTKSPRPPRRRWRPPSRSASIRCSSMAAPAAARPTCCTPSATPSCRRTVRRESCRCRPRSSWSSSSAR